MPNKLGLLAALLLLAGCFGGGTGDGPPSRDINVEGIPDAVPRVEPVTRAGNPNPYTVLGKTYHLLPVGAAYKERGIGSWYGTKFHGQKTSNGETYSMYAMTAAHKTLRIPGYVRVTNLENGRRVIVRVNDRGPFHGGRIIDLSYAAAKKLGYSDKGTARVEVEAIDPRHYQKNFVEAPSIAARAEPVASEPLQQVAALSQEPVTEERFQLPDNTYLQVGAFASEPTARDLIGRLQGVTDTPVVIRHRQQPSPLFKVLVGPVKDNMELLNLRNLLKQAENLTAFVVYE